MPPHANKNTLPKFELSATFGLLRGRATEPPTEGLEGVTDSTYLLHCTAIESVYVIMSRYVMETEHTTQCIVLETLH